MNSPIVYIEVECEENDVDFYAYGVNVIENPDEFKVRIANTGRPPASFKILEFLCVLAVEIAYCKSKNDLIPSKVSRFGFLTNGDLLRFFEEALPDRIEPTMSRRPSGRVLEIYNSLAKRWPSITHLIAYASCISANDCWEFTE